MERTEASNIWLNINLSIEKNIEGGFFFIIEFSNKDAVTHTLEFSNRSAKAEFMCLTIYDQNRNMVNPQRREMPRLKNYQPDCHKLGPGGSWFYKLEAKFIDYEWLEFRGAAYRLKKNSKYFCQFECFGITSNYCDLLV
jgi:hypothetical protein